MIDILMATYNGDAHIRQQLDSIFAQSFTDWRLIIRDDGSTDGTLDIINEYMAFYPDKIKLIRDYMPTGSAKGNFLELIRASEGEYMAFADQDDVWHRDKLAKSYEAMKELELQYGAGVPLMVHTDLNVVDERLGQLAPSFTRLMKLPVKKHLRDIIIQNSVVGCTMIINRTLADMCGELRDVSRILMHDHAIAIMAYAYGHAAYIDAPLVDYRQHGDNQVGAKEGLALFSFVRRFKAGKKHFRDDMDASYEQVAYILECYGRDFVKPEYDAMLAGYARLGQAGTKGKREFYKKYKIYKHGFLKKLVQILWS